MITKYEINKTGDIVLSTVTGGKFQFKKNKLDKKIKDEIECFKLFMPSKKLSKEGEDLLKDFKIDEKIKKSYLEFVLGEIKEKVEEYDLVIFDDFLINDKYNSDYTLQLLTDFENKKDKFVFTSDLLRRLNLEERKIFLEYSQDQNLLYSKEIIKKIKDLGLVPKSLDEYFEKLNDKSVLIVSNNFNEILNKANYLYKFGIKLVDNLIIF